MNLITKIIKNVRAYKYSPAFFIATFTAFVFISGCKTKNSNSQEESAATVTPSVPVNVVSPRIGTISESENLNAASVYLLNDIVRSPIAGYVTKVDVTPGQLIHAGSVLFSVQSKEAAALAPDTLFPAGGIITVKANRAGIIKKVQRQAGDYMQGGDSFCTIADNSSLVFMLHIPFEIHNYIKQNGLYTVLLPDGEKIKTRVSSQIPEMDQTVQMEKYVLRPIEPLTLPEGLVGIVTIPTYSQTHAVILPKSAILCNETQTNFWVMKVLHDTFAVRVNIKKGLATKDSVEVMSPIFSEADKILVTGNYGVPDTLKVKILK